MLWTNYADSRPAALSDSRLQKSKQLVDIKEVNIREYSTTLYQSLSPNLQLRNRKF